MRFSYAQYFTPRIEPSPDKFALPDKCKHSMPGALSASNQDSEIPRANLEELFAERWAVDRPRKALVL
jgi:hypothetical protein